MASKQRYDSATHAVATSAYEFALAVLEGELGMQVASMNEFGFENLTPEKAPVVVMVASSTGDGDPPDNSAKFFMALKRKTNANQLLQVGHCRAMRPCNALQHVKALIYCATPTPTPLPGTYWLLGCFDCRVFYSLASDWGTPTIPGSAAFLALFGLVLKAWVPQR